MKTRIRILFSLLFASFFMQAQISEKRDDVELKQINSMVTEAKSVTDQVINDDLIVTSSACVGFDCVNGESFGFDTIRLKENNLRIKAQDTSSSASFPSNDWQITFNDTSNGGQNKFSIDDIDGGRTPFTIEASAPSHSLYVDDGGRIGLGTSTPVAEIHSKDGDTPTLRLEQDGSSGFTPQTWDIASNETNFFIRDATNGSKLPFRIMSGGAPTNSLVIASDGDIGLGIQSPGGLLDVNKRLVVKSDTSVGIATSTPTARLEIKGNTAGGTNLRASGNKAQLIVDYNELGYNYYDAAFHNFRSFSGTPFLSINSSGNVGIGIPNASNKLQVIGNTRIEGNLVVTGTVTATVGGVNSVGDGSGKVLGSEETPFPQLYVNGNSNFDDVSYFSKDIYVKGSVMPGSIYGPSDARIKNDISPLSDATSVVMNLYPKTFFYKKEFTEELGLPETKQFGLIAQEVEKSLPELVKEFETKSGKSFKSVNYNALIPVLVQALKEQKVRIDELENEVSNYASLDNRLRAMEAQLNAKNKNAKR
ncbi:tail fiber domain-containing protein [uncultured Arcticibacterium sp.]|uniref:tail fiber domain-containing protein n=1 Tax=uncultured Arcticibacterium sp. TaxID=2173042 RepID=UPI0030F59F8D